MSSAFVIRPMLPSIAERSPASPRNGLWLPLVVWAFIITTVASFRVRHAEDLWADGGIDWQVKYQAASWVALGLLAAWLFLGVRLPADAATAGLFAASTVLGFLVLFHIAFLLGSLAVVTLDIRSFAWSYYSLVALLAGQVVPLWLFPDVLRRVAEVLPFQGIYFTPMSIYIGTLAGEAALRALALQAVWVVALAVVARWAWGRLHRRLVVQGG